MYILNDLARFAHSSRCMVLSLARGPGRVVSHAHRTAQFALVATQQLFELYPSNKFILRGEDYTVCSRWGVCVVKLQPSFGGEFWILGDVFIEVRYAGMCFFFCV